MIYTNDEIRWVHGRTDGCCFYCGRLLALPHYDMIAEWGAWEINCFIPELENRGRGRENWVPACLPCDTLKGERFPWEYDACRFRKGDENPDNYIMKKAGVPPT